METQDIVTVDFATMQPGLTSVCPIELVKTINH